MVHTYQIYATQMITVLISESLGGLQSMLTRVADVDREFDQEINTYTKMKRMTIRKKYDEDEKAELT